jgi:hypothetical protein
MRKQIAVALLACLCAAPGFAAAVETVRVAVPDRGAWDTSYTAFGIEQGFFAHEGLDVRIVPVADAAALAQALTSGKADIAVAAGYVDVVTAWLKGAPIRIISPESTGAPEIFWFAKIAGPVASMRDLHGEPVGYSRPGALSYFVLRTLLQKAGVDNANLVPVGSAEAGYPAVLGAQLAASWSKPPFNVTYLLAGEIRIIARATIRKSCATRHFGSMPSTRTFSPTIAALSSASSRPTEDPSIGPTQIRSRSMPMRGSRISPWRPQNTSSRIFRPRRLLRSIRSRARTACSHRRSRQSA